MLMPKRVKYRKAHKASLSGFASSGNAIAFGEYGLKSVGRAYVTARQIEAARISLSRALKKGGKIWIRIFPDHPVTRKPAETRMGKGKGEPSYWVSVVKPGRIIFEVEGVPESLAKEALRVAGNKFPMPSIFIKREVL